MKKTTLLIALALLFGAKAFAQEWEWNFTPPYVYSTFSDLCELSDGRIVVIGNFREADPCDIWRQHFPALVLLDSDGTELATAQYPKEGYFGNSPSMLEDGQGRVFGYTYHPNRP